MFSTTATKLVTSAFVILASASGMAGVDRSTSAVSKSRQMPVTLDSTSLLVATLANGEIETHWMPREACERVEAAVAAGEGVAGVRPDGVRVYLAQANCSTRRIEVDPTPVALSSSKVGD